MYERFFGLEEQPFRLTPDPRYLFLSAKHREALGHLIYGIREGAGFVAITGEVGAGKTTLLRSFMAEPDEGVRYAYILNPVLTGIELLQEINHELGLSQEGTRRELLATLNHFLLEQKRAGRQVALVIDEAQTLDGAVLEQLRMLSNFETETTKLLQIVLVGQPELRDLLSRPDLRQLDQRITVRWHLGPLDQEETAQYVQHRLATASGGRPRSIFTGRAIQRIHAYAHGLPRLINIVCHRALLVAYASDRSKVTPRLVARAIAEIEQPSRDARHSERPLRRYAMAAAAVALLTAAGVVGWQQGFLPRITWRDANVAPSSGASEGAPPAPLAAQAGGVPERLAPGTEVAEPGVRAPGARAPVQAVAPPVDVELAAVEATAGPEPIQDPFWVERMALSDATRQTSTGGSAYESVEALLRAWGARGLDPGEAAGAQLDLASIASRRGLGHLPFQGNLNLLRVLDLPAILEVVLEDGSARFAMVDRLGEDRARVHLGRTQIELSPTMLSEVWFGQGHLFWRDVDELGLLLARGSSGKQVGRLHELLREAGAYKGPAGAVFSPATEQAVIDFQRESRLSADGKVGPMTMIALYQRVSADRLPHLGEADLRGAGGGEERLSALDSGERQGGEVR